MSLRFARETVGQVIEEIKPLIAKHYREIAHYQDIALDPDYARYRAMEALGVLRIFTVRVDGRLAGYAIFAVCPALHYKTSLQATCDILFIDPAQRHGLGIASSLLSHCDLQLGNEGVQVVYQRTKAAHDFSNLLAAKGYTLVDHVHAKRLDHGSDVRTRR